MRVCTVLATGRIFQAQSNDAAGFESLLANALAAGYTPDQVVCEIRPEAAVTAALVLQNAYDAVVAARPPAGAVVSRAEFKKRIAPAYLALAVATEATQRKWDRVLGGLLDDFIEVTLTDQTLIDLMQLAVADGLLSPPQAQAALAIP